MRRLALAIALVPLATATRADTDAVVSAREVVVYAAPGEATPDTGTLPRGTRLQVHHEEPGGWLAIQPPNGSISWVNHRFLDFGDFGMPRLPASVSIRCGMEGVEIEAGKYAVNGPLGVRRTKLAADTVVTVMGPKAQWAGDNSYWYPIWSPSGDYRYVRREGITAAPAERTVIQTSGTVDTPLATSPLSGDGFKTTRPADWPSHPLWKQAEAADKAGDWTQAERFYFQLAGEMNKPGGDVELANLSFSRIHSIRERRRTTKGGESVAVRTTNPNTTFEVIPTSSATTTTGTASTPPARDPKDARYGPGTLYVAIGRYQNQTVFALESEPGRVVAYCIPAPGFDLQQHLRKKVTVVGKVIDANFMAGVLVSVNQVDAAK